MKQDLPRVHGHSYRPVEDVVFVLALDEIVSLEEDCLVHTNVSGKGDEVGNVVAGVERARLGLLVALERGGHGQGALRVVAGKLPCLLRLVTLVNELGQLHQQRPIFWTVECGG